MLSVGLRDSIPYIAPARGLVLALLSAISPEKVTALYLRSGLGRLPLPITCTDVRVW